MSRTRPAGGTTSHDVAGEPAAIYCRISQADDDDQTGVDRQERICREIAERRGLVINPAHVFVDNSRSAWSRRRKRPGWDRLLDDARERSFRHVIAYHPDRLMRQPRDLEELLQVADDHAITLHGEANRRDLSDPDDRFILRIEVAHACRSSDDTSRRLKSAMQDRAREGKPQGGMRRFGYTKDGMTIVEEEAEVVREVFDRYLKGEGAAPLAKDLHSRGIRTAGGKAWSAGTVRGLLDSRHVAGIRMHQGEEVGPGTWPAIIDAGVWAEVRARREFRSAAHKETLSKPRQRYYLLRGLVMCGRCGTLMSGTAKTAGPAYQCNRRGRNDEKKCSRAIVAPTLEDFVSDAAVKLLSELRVDGRLATSNLSEGVAEEVEDDQRQLAELNEMWTAKELSTAEYRKMRKEITDRIAKAQRRVIIRPMVLLDGLTGTGARAAWDADEMTDERRNAVLRFLFSGVVIDEPKKLGRYMDWDRISIEQNPL
ncbi:recombinase family protein [Actinacidiphila bryophytorum]|uniref:Site-specific DNA recombinase n=1 Tax=Actinacidiphila bryophytorum TaxID=1436133 RepID=A0A9W4MJ32_9ACTN|nr:recombinase family protein [Actinacidiphila bryophytorum]MBM9435945.1 recombinase family protein [Actinacidiphila bryophytorum]MBN6541492.1 recombinase family protein [Actinacidiphila bryophytorum]CAG7649446.1 Site-specific DNA recombinase [Actinacidiphila bryophytorum]